MQRILKIYVLGVSLFAVLSFLGLIAIIYLLDPTQGFTNKLLFYLDFAIFVFLLGSLLGYYLRKKFGQRELQLRHFRVSIRQAVWFSVLITTSLFLISNDLFSLTNTILLLLALIFLESFFVSRQNRSNN